jgi:hypothetical protein
MFIDSYSSEEIGLLERVRDYCEPMRCPIIWTIII